MIRVRVIIEPSWAAVALDEVIEIPAAALEGLDGEDRQNKIIDLASDFVGDQCPWSVEEVDKP